MDKQIERIWLKSCEMRGVSPEDIRSRKRDMVAARHDTWILCADLGISYKRIDREMGFDHVTVLQGVRTGLDDIKFVRGYRKTFNALCDALGMENSKRYG